MREDPARGLCGAVLAALWRGGSGGVGCRAQPADAYLRPALSRPNLTVHTGCLVTRLCIWLGRCTGVTYLRGALAEQADAADEVIVCAGAVGSPQLLMLSGIGPAGQLRKLGIDPVADLPGVGANLQDHPVVLACYDAATPLPASRYNHGETYAALHSGLSGGWPDRPRFPARARRHRPAGSRAGHHPPGRLRRRLHQAGHHRDLVRLRRPHQQRPAPLHPAHSRQLLPPGRHLPHRTGHGQGRGGGPAAAGPRDNRAARR
jgi:choline dehydrogenase-like flavoprotein